MRAWRFPALLAIPALLVAGVVVQQRTADERATTAAVVAGEDVSRAMPTARPEGASSSTWYCAAGTATGTPEGRAEQTVQLANFGDGPVRVKLAVYAAGGAPAFREVEVAAGSRREVKASEVVTAAWASVLVEADAGGLAVTHELVGPNGRSVSPCASAPSDRWYFPSGSTRPGTSLDLVVFNPFPDGAVLDLSFEAEDGRRDPQAYQGLVIPPGAVVPVEVSKVVTVRERVATSVVARSGRVVVEQVQAWDGGNGLPRGLAAVLGAPRLERNWVFAEGRPVEEGVDQRYVVFNPGGQPAEVDVQVTTDQQQLVGPIEAYSVTVPAHGSAEVEVGSDERVPPGYGHWVTVSSPTPIAAARRVALGATPNQLVSLTNGSPAQARRWVVAAASGPEVGAATVTVVNPSDTESARLTVWVVRGGRREALERFDDVDLGPGARTQASIEKLPGAAEASVLVEATVPVVVELAQVASLVPPGKAAGSGELASLTSSMAEPVAGTAELASPPVAADDAAAGSTGVLDPATLPPELGSIGPGDSSPPSSADAGGAPGGTSTATAP